MKNLDPNDGRYPYPIMNASSQGVHIQNESPEDDAHVKLEEIVVDPTYADLKAILTRGYTHFAWTNDLPDAQPLLIDVQTAHVMVTVHDALNEKNQAKFEGQVHDNRGYFGRLVDLCWSCVKAG